ncbi:MAG: hypothetical protein MHMPM18_004541, partial [Marteilia pararefringens]
EKFEPYSNGDNDESLNVVEKLKLSSESFITLFKEKCEELSKIKAELFELKQESEKSKENLCATNYELNAMRKSFEENEINQKKIKDVTESELKLLRLQLSNLETENEDLKLRIAEKNFHNFTQPRPVMESPNLLQSISTKHSPAVNSVAEEVTRRERGNMIKSQTLPMTPKIKRKSKAIRTTPKRNKTTVDDPIRIRVTPKKPKIQSPAKSKKNWFDSDSVFGFDS